MHGATAAKSISRNLWFAWAAAVVFLGLLMAAAAIPVLIGRYPATDVLWALYFDVTKPFSVAWLPANRVAEASYETVMVLLAFLVFLLAVEIRFKTIYISVVLLSAMWVLTLLVFSNYFYRYLTSDLSLETSPAYLKLVLIVVLGHFFYAGLRDIYLGFKRRRRQGA